MGKQWDETVAMAHRILQDRARLLAEERRTAGQRHLTPVPTPSPDQLNGDK